MTAATPRAHARAGDRLLALDGLRGVAALVVVLFHLSLVARPALESGSTEPLWRIATESPLKLAFAGTEAVLVFFALSGLVVALPVLRAGSGFSFAGFLASRGIRLYLPVWGAIALSAALVALLPRPESAATPGSWLDTANVRELDPLQLALEASLTPATYDVVNTLWSLRWELAFSLLLPAFVALAVAMRRHALGLGALSIAATIAGRIVEVEALVYLPVFLLGTLVAVRLDDVRAWAATRGRGTWAALAAASGVLLIASWLGRPLVGTGSTAASTLWGLAGAGAIGVVLLAIGSPATRRVLESRAAQHLGRLSFSLYLVHVPVIATVAYLVGDAEWPLVALVSVPASLVIAWGFHAVVERPSHRLARAAGRRVGRTAVRTLAPSRDAGELVSPAGAPSSR